MQNSENNWFKYVYFVRMTILGVKETAIVLNRSVKLCERQWK